MTVEETAAYLRLAPWAILHWVSQRKSPYVRLGRSVRFRRKDLERFVNQNLHGKIDERNGNGCPPEDRVALPTVCDGKQAGGRENLDGQETRRSHRVNGHDGRRMT